VPPLKPAHGSNAVATTGPARLPARPATPAL